jgi:transcriptional regulator with XRE-family HTH domain
MALFLPEESYFSREVFEELLQLTCWRINTYTCFFTQLGVGRGMFENRIKELRKAKGLTQKQLADAAKTSQQQIQRIEAGNQHARFDLATQISAALGQPIGKVFPSAALPLARLNRRPEANLDKTTSEELEGAGLDMEPDLWTAKYKLRGGAQGQLEISGPDMHRLHSLLQDHVESGFVVIASTERQFAFNLKHLIFCHILFDRPSNVRAVVQEKTNEVEFYLTAEREPLRFGVDPDTTSLDEEEDPEPLSVQLQDLFYNAELATDLPRLNFVDEDGETVFLRCDDVSMFSVPLWLIEPNVSEEENEETEGGQDG